MYTHQSRRAKKRKGENMEHIGSMRMYVEYYELIGEIREGRADAEAMKHIVQEGRDYIINHFSSRYKLDEKTMSRIMPDPEEIACGQRILEKAEIIIHKLRREMMYYNKLILNQEVPTKYQDNDWPMDVNENEFGETIMMPELQISDDDMNALLEDTNTAINWYDNVCIIMEEYANYLDDLNYIKARGNGKTASQKTDEK